MRWERQADGLRKWLCIVLTLLAVLAPQLRAETLDEFYRAKRINLIVGYGPGGGYDVFARLLARHLGRYVPGNPQILVQNMPGAGSLIAANYLYSVAPKDGTAIGLFARDMPLLGLLGNSANVQFDPRKFQWLGSSSSFADDAYVMIVRADAPVQSIEDLRWPGGVPLLLGGTADGTTGSDVPRILADALGLNIKLVLGYRDTAAIFLAMERGEVSGRMTDLSAIQSLRPDWLRRGGGYRLLLQFARVTRHPDYPEVPTARELASSQDARELIEFTETPLLTMARPFAAPPEVPQDRGQGAEGGVCCRASRSAIRRGGGQARGVYQSGRRAGHGSQHREYGPRIAWAFRPSAQAARGQKKRLTDFYITSPITSSPCAGGRW
jgi:tripartite-type tricarboxylate transporter receptor subunit TctC